MTTPPVPAPAPPVDAYPPLVDPNDPDWAAFQANDPTYFLKVAGHRIRTYCGWRIYPNGTDTAINLRVKSGGRIILPSTYVTDVSSLVVQTGPDTQIDVDLDFVVWDQQGWIQPLGTTTGWYAQGISGYYYGPDMPSYIPWLNLGYAQVTFTHGYPALPDDVKIVAYELAEVAAEMNAGNVSDVATPGGFSLKLTKPPGLNLNQDQMDRLAPYRRPVVI